MKMTCAWFVQCPEQVTSLDKNSYQHHQNLPISYNLLKTCSALENSLLRNILRDISARSYLRILEGINLVQSH